MERVAWSLDEVASLRAVSEPEVRRLVGLLALAHVRIGTSKRGRVLILEGDVAGGDDAGPAVLARAWRGRVRVALGKVARSLGVNARTLKRLAACDGFPAARGVNGRWECPRDELVRWILQRRQPTRWEIAA